MRLTGRDARFCVLFIIERRKILRLYGWNGIKKQYSLKNSRDCSGKPGSTRASGTRCGGYGAASGIDRQTDVERHGG